MYHGLSSTPAIQCRCYEYDSCCYDHGYDDGGDDDGGDDADVCFHDRFLEATIVPVIEFKI